ncbi:MAG TPA: winged helix-turn-helix domain-containing tetratricopeptide repeat protein [Xanthobacteraceae bacterium]|nr:winged helix-turn-helix domain-containing tetratricopeptide repeat protein [Xanthobacteraceae bacterium]
MLYTFENYALDAERRELRREGRPVHLEPQIFDLLEYLICNRERVVSKDDLIAGVWHRRIVSDSTLASRINAARSAIGDNGKQQRLIKTFSRKGLRFVGPVLEKRGPAKIPTATASAPRRSDEPSIAVLPFQNMSGEPDQDYFCDGIVEDIITALSRMRRLLVIARNSTFVYKGRTVDVKQIGRELSARYVLEGSVRKANRLVRITAQLIDASTGAHLWAERFESALKDIFDLQDQIAVRVVTAITPKLERAEIERAKRKPTESLDAYDYYLRGMASFYRGTRKALSDALEQFQTAIALDSEFPAAYGMAAWCYVQRRNNGWMIDSVEETASAERLAWRAVRSGKDDPIALYTGGWALARVEGQLDAGAAMIDRALTLDPNLAAAWHSSGWVRIYLGQPDAAIEHIEHAMRLSPLDPLFFGMLNGMAAAHFLAGRYEKASSWAEKALRDHPNYLPALRMSAASNALAGRLEEARKAMARMRQFDPALRVGGLKDVVPFRGPQDCARYVHGLRTAGLPN